MTRLAQNGLIAALRRGLASLDQAFCKLNRIQFDAPWREDRAGRC